MIQLVVVDDAEAAAREAAARLAEAAGAGADVALAGGTTPGIAYRLAAELEPDWSRARVWWGDERCVPPDDQRSNYRLAKESLFDGLARRPEVHRVRGELEPEEGARLYDEELAGVSLDLTLLGLGTDGHTASLFPGMPSLAERARRAIATPPGLDPRVDRVTMTIPMLADSRIVLFLVTGAEKAEAAARAFANEQDPATPASLVRSATGRTIAILDRSAAAHIGST